MPYPPEPCAGWKTCGGAAGAYASWETSCWEYCGGGAKVVGGATGAAAGGALGVCAYDWNTCGSGCGSGCCVGWVDGGGWLYALWGEVGDVTPNCPDPEGWNATGGALVAGFDGINTFAMGGWDVDIVE